MSASKKENKKFVVTRGMVLLSLIILIVIIIIIVFVLKSSKKEKTLEYSSSDFEYLETRMKEETENYIKQNKVKINKKYIINLNELLEKNGGYISEKKVKATNICIGYVKVIEEKEIEYKSYIKCKDKYITDGYDEEDYLSTAKQEKETERDNEKPVISLIGDNPLIIYKNSEYKEPGFKAVDNLDGDITSNVSIEGLKKLNTSKIGEYEITYSVKDKANNESSVVRKIIVKEKETIKTTTKINTTTKKTYNYATTKKVTTTKKTTSNLVLTLVGSDVKYTVGESYKEKGYSAYSNGKNITSKVVVTNNINKNVPGTYKVTYKVTDSTGNSVTKVRNVTYVKKEIELQSISVVPNAITLKKGETKKLSIYYNPSNISNKNVKYSSSNNGIATISSTGVITAKSTGVAIITITSMYNTNIKTTCTVTVSK